MLTLLELRLERLRQRINQKPPQAPESVLEQVWTILNAANEDEELYAEFDSLSEQLSRRKRRLIDERNCSRTLTSDYAKDVF